MKPTAYYLLLVMTLLLLSGCSQTPTKAPKDLQQSHQAIPQDWAIVAKLGIKNSSDSGSVTLHWQQQQEHYRIQLQGPLGQGRALITGDLHNITIERPNKDTLIGRQPEPFIRAVFGWSLPLQHLGFWIRGLASPHLAIEQQALTESGILSYLEQDGWTLEYSKHTLNKQWLLPTRIRATKGDTRLTLLVKSWALTPTPLTASNP